MKNRRFDREVAIKARTRNLEHDLPMAVRLGGRARGTFGTIRQVAKFELAINLKTAKALGESGVLANRARELVDGGIELLFKLALTVPEMRGHVEDVERQLGAFVSHMDHRLAERTGKPELVEHVRACAAELGDDKC